MSNITENVKNAGNAAVEKIQETKEKGKYEANKNSAMNPDNTIGTRVEAGVDAVGNKWNEKAHEMNKEDYKDQSGITGVVEGVKNAFGAACEKVKETVSGAKYEANKSVAENPDNTIGNRVHAAYDAVGNKISEKAHEIKGDQQSDRAGITTKTP